MNATPSLPIRSRTVFIFLALTGLIAYLNSLHTPFHYDDIYYLKENLGIKSFVYFQNWLSGGFGVLFRARPFLLLTFIANYKLGGLDTTGYHLLNLFIHIGNAFLVYLLLFRYAEPDKEKGYSLKSILAAVLFLLHPVNTESVTYISSRSSELSALFVLFSMYCFFRATEQRFHPGYYLLSLCSFLLGLMTKESALVLPMLLLVFDYFFISTGPKALLARIKYHLPVLLMIISVSFYYASLIFAPQLDVQRPWMTHILTELRVFARYFQLLIVPVGLNIDHEVVPSTGVDAGVFASLLALSALLITALVVKKRFPAISFSVFWFFINVAPFLFIRLNDYMAERWIYLASIGVCIAFAEVLMQLIIHRRETGIVMTGAAVLMSGAMTIMRNHVYASPVSLWQDAAQKSPGKYRPLLNLSSAYMENGNTLMATINAEQAIKQWEKSGSKGRDIIVAYTNIASAPEVDAKWSARMLKTIEREASGTVDYYGARGAISLNAGDYQAAIGSFEKALALSPQSAAFLYLIGECHDNLGRKKTAREYFVRATTVVPQTAQEFMGQGEAYSRLGDYQKASECFHEAIRTDPLDVSMRVYFATIMLKNGYLDEAFKHFSIALHISPVYAPALKGLGLVMLRKGRPGDAVRYFDRALDLLPPASAERKNVQELKDKARDAKN